MVKTVSDRKEELITNLAAARQAVLAEIGGLSPYQLDEACIGFWCAKDLLAHLIGWDFTNLEAVQEILAGKRPTFFQYYDKDWQTYNARLVATYRKEPFAALLADAEQSHSQFVTFLHSLSANELVNGKSPPDQGRTITIRNLLKAEASDEQKHAEQLHHFFAPAAPSDERDSSRGV